MANNIEDSLVYWLHLDASSKEKLGFVRDWENVKMGVSGNDIWLKGLSDKQIYSIEIQTILNKKIFTERDGFLFLQDSLLPWGKEPSLVWSAINRALPINFPNLNYNFFSIQDILDIKLIPFEKEQPADALLVKMEALENYLEKAPKVRIEKIKWTVVDQHHALLIGKPILPISGAVFWRNKNFLLPAGWNFQFEILAEEIAMNLHLEGDDMACFFSNNRFQIIKSSMVEKLSKSSFHYTKEKLANSDVPDRLF